jgi:restriction system protein
MSVWMVRAGRHGEREDLALGQNLVAIGWSQMGDLSRVPTRDALLTLLLEAYPDERRRAVANWAGQLWTFVFRIEVGDLVCMPLRARATIAVGKIAGPYRYRTDLPPEARHVRPVLWLNTELPRAAFEQDLLYSLGALGTVRQIQRNQAEARLQAILSTGTDPVMVPGPILPPNGDDGDGLLPTDLEGYARDQIVAYLGRHFRGHELARLVSALLGAEGYQIMVSPVGPDGGVDILAGQGPLGFESPRLCVQVKSGEGPADVRVLRELQGIMPNYGAQMGLLVSWGGFRGAVYAEARAKFFTIRLWDANDLVTALLASYERLSEEIQAELPLKRIWTLVPAEE